VTLTSFDRAARREEESRTLTFDDVYETYATTVARWVARLGGPGADVEDLTQEVFLVVDRRLPEFRGQSRVSTWIFAIAARVTANDRRRRRLRAWWTRLGPNAGERVADTAETAIEELEKRERRAQFYAALDALVERQRRVLVLFELEDMSIAEIAALMGLRAGAVRVLLHRARRAFLKRMTERDLEEALAAGLADASETETKKTTESEK
jgi:RNA polymerase sigma-70 factor (ECF subfamily)